MDSIDHALSNAWHALRHHLRANRTLALRRAARMHAATLRRPVRPWTCCIRASDTRLLALASFDDLSAARTNRAHTVTLDAPALRALCAPVHINWPGLPWTRAAALLGRHPESLRAWMRAGVFTIRHQPASTLNQRGKPIPILWSPTALDPNADQGRAPDPIWGTLWQHLYTEIPDACTLTARRVPITALYSSIHTQGRTSPRHRGWQFQCPGLSPQGCRNPRALQGLSRTDRLFLPRPVWSMLHMLHAPIADDHTNTRQHEHAGLYTTRWACHHCHQLRYCSLADRNGWNLFISHLTQGLLFGHEVPRPNNLRITRRRKSTTRTSPKRKRGATQSQTERARRASEATLTPPPRNSTPLDPGGAKACSHE